MKLVRRKKYCVSANPTDPVSNTRLCYFFYQLKCKITEVKHRFSTKYLYFHKITGPTLFFSRVKIEKKKKKKKKKPFSYLPTIYLFSVCWRKHSYFLRLNIIPYTFEPQREKTYRAMFPPSKIFVWRNCQTASFFSLRLFGKTFHGHMNRTKISLHFVC